MKHRTGRSRKSTGFLRDTAGQDLVEYALLVALVGFVALAAAPAIQNALGTAYVLYNTNTQDLWQPPNPAP